jgi:type I restriction enzyme, S subunit
MMKAWKLRPLEQIVTLQRGFDLPTQHRAAGTVAVIGSNGIVGMHDSVPKGVPVPGLMVGRSGSVGKLTYWDQEYWPLNTSLYVKDFHGNDPKFLSYWLQLFPFKQYAEGVSVPTLNRNSVSDIPFPLPDEDNQKSIARSLDAITLSIDLQRDLLASSQELKRATMRELFTHGLRGEAQKDSEIGPVPESWADREWLNAEKDYSGILGRWHLSVADQRQSL